MSRTTQKTSIDTSGRPNFSSITAWLEWSSKNRIHLKGLAMTGIPTAWNARSIRQPRASLRSGLITLFCAASMALSACGGGNGVSAPLPVTPASPSPAEAPTRSDAARFLTQASFGPAPADVDRLVALGYSAWLDEQFGAAASTHLPAVPAFTDTLSPQFVGAYPILSSFWTKAARAPDQLRQRTAFALSQLFVISMIDMNVMGYPQGIATYMDMLGRDSFGNFRQLLEDVTLSPMMGLYLSHLGNQKEDPANGRVPDENYAREVMQLFTIGLYELNPDGSVKLNARREPIETYSNDDVMGLARVFTGWSWASPVKDEASFQAFRGFLVTDDRALKPMQPYPQFHSASAKTFLGKTIPEQTGAQESLKQALDQLFNHPNVGPFIGKQLIQRLVTSNPSPAYVARVSAAFANNGLGVRGDMKAVWRAILLDPEARDRAKLLDPNYGKLREPVLRLSAWMRAFDVKSSSGNYNVFFTDDPASGIGQAPFRSPSVFNFYRPGYVPPNSGAAAAGLVVPEMQITSETSASSYINFVQSMAVLGGAGFLLDLTADYSAEKAIADDADALVNRMDALLTCGAMSAATRAIVLEAVSSVPITALDARANRVRLALLFTLSSPDFIVQR
jgi:uncharacterized protein (DUF1800 family)